MAVDSKPTARSEEGAPPRRSGSETAGLVFGVVGMVAVGFGLVLYVLEPRLLPLSVGNAVFGLIGLAIYVLTNRPALGRAVRGRSAPLVALEAVLAAGVAGLVIVANYAAAQSAVEWDLTRDALFTLHRQSREVAEAVDRDVTVYGFHAPSDDTRGRLSELVRLYRKHTDRVTLELVDPDRASPQLLERFELSSKSPRIVVATEDRDVKIREPSEQALTNALVQLVERPVLSVGFVRGHLERGIESLTVPEGLGSAAQALRDDGFEVGPLEIGTTALDVDLAVVGGAVRSFLPAELVVLRRYLDQGGRLLVLADPAADTPGLADLLADFDTQLGNDVVVDPDPAAKSIGFEDDAPVIRRYEPHPITDPLKNQVTVFIRAQSVSPTLGATDVATLIRTSEESWAEADPRAEPPYALDADDAPGPIPIAAAVDRGLSGARDRRLDAARLVVIGDVDFATNEFIGLGANRDLFLNSAAWLLGTSEKITLRPKSRSGDRLPVTEAQLFGIMFFSVNLLPLLIVGFGFSVWAVRRRK
jgi:ABC-type uncharacterized transport system involved in gliding motility auxiliary subunit